MTEKEKRKEHKEDREYFNDRYDIMKHGSTVKSYDAIGLNEDILMAELDDSQKEFINTQFKLAEELRDYLQDKDVANRLAGRMIIESQTISNLERNKENNPIQKWLLEGGLREEEMKEEEKGGLLRPKKDKEM